MQLAPRHVVRSHCGTTALVAMLLACVAAAGCGNEPRAEESAESRPAASQPTSGVQAAAFDFGRSVCGVCCIGIMREAFSPVDGFVDVEAKIGPDPRFTVKYDASKTNRDELLRIGKAMIPALK